MLLPHLLRHMGYVLPPSLSTLRRSWSGIAVALDQVMITPLPRGCTSIKFRIRGLQNIKERLLPFQVLNTSSFHPVLKHASLHRTKHKETS